MIDSKILIYRYIFTTITYYAVVVINISMTHVLNNTSCYPHTDRNLIALTRAHTYQAITQSE